MRWWRSQVIIPVFVGACTFLLFMIDDARRNAKQAGVTRDDIAYLVAQEQFDQSRTGEYQSAPIKRDGSERCNATTPRESRLAMKKSSCRCDSLETLVVTEGSQAVTAGIGASIAEGVQQAFNFAFSVFCFFASFCSSVYILDSLYETSAASHNSVTANEDDSTKSLSLYQSLTRRARNTRPYSPTLMKLQAELCRACAQGDSRITCLADQFLNPGEIAEVLLPLIMQGKAQHWKALDLSCNDVTDAGLERILDGLIKSGCQLEELSLKRCGLKSVSPLLIQYIRSLSLKELHLGNNHLEDRGVAVLARSLPFSALVSLNLSNNDLSDESLRVLCSAFPFKEATNLKQLHLRGNRIMDGGVRCLARSPLFLVLQLLDLSANPITDEGLCSMAEAFVGAAALNELSISDNSFITNAGVSKLVHGVLQFDVHLSRLLLNNIRLLTEDIVDLLEKDLLRKSPSLKHISLSGNAQIDADRLERLQEALVTTKSAWFRVAIVLLGTKDVKRVGDQLNAQQSPVRLLNKDVMRLVVESMAKVET